MMWPYYDGVGWLWMAAMMVLFWGGLLAIVVWLIRGTARPHRSDEALETLRRRLASGEITPEQFEQTKRTLQG